jgi:membrane-bound lytic murein transglycosylase D
MPYNNVVQKFIDQYTGKLNRTISFCLGAGNFYIPLFEEALEHHGLPLELKYLPIIESSLNPIARSKAGAVGLWQFMLATGKRYDLEVNSLVDERQDPVKSTWAAARYLKELYNIYGDWSLVIAAYNYGPGNVNKAIHRAGGVADYWTIYPYLPTETRGYVPAFIAANYVFNYHKEHGIFPLESNLPTLCDSIVLNEPVHFEQIAAKLDISVEELRDLNPQYRADVIPSGYGKSYVLRIPYNHVNNFIDLQDSIFAELVNRIIKNDWINYRKKVS